MCDSSSSCSQDSVNFDTYMNNCDKLEKASSKFVRDIKILALLARDVESELSNYVPCSYVLANQLKTAIELVKRACTDLDNEEELINILL